MNIVVLFGLPGVGKTYVGKDFEKEFEFYFYDGDSDIPEDMKRALHKNQVISEDMRERFSHNMIKHVEYLLTRHKKIIIAQTFLKEKFRRIFLQKFPFAKFILITTSDILRESRYDARKEWFLGIDYLRKMSLLFDEPHVPYITIDNSKNGEKHVMGQIEKMITLENQ